MRLRRFTLCFDAHRADGRVWCVKLGRDRWRNAKTVRVSVPLTSVYKGRTARQPRAYFTGICHSLTASKGGLTLA
jgi:hypothetical protein